MLNNVPRSGGLGSLTCSLISEPIVSLVLSQTIDEIDFLKISQLFSDSLSFRFIELFGFFVYLHLQLFYVNLMYFCMKYFFKSSTHFRALGWLSRLNI